MNEIIASVTPYLDQVDAQIKNLPSWGLLLAHSAFCACLADDVRDRYLLHYWLTFAMGFGGGALSAFLLARPDDVPVNFFISHIDVIWTFAWWAANYVPTGTPGRIIRLKPVKLLLKLALQVLRSRTICARVSQTAKYYPSTVVAPIVMGVVGGSGGKLLGDIIRGGYHISMGRDEMSVPSMSFHSSTFATVVYYCLVHLSQLLTQAQGLTLVIILLSIHGLLMDIAGIDFVKPIARIFHLLSNVPQPVVMSAPPTRKPKSKQEETKKKE